MLLLEVGPCSGGEKGPDNTDVALSVCVGGASKQGWFRKARRLERPQQQWAEEDLQSEGPTSLCRQSSSRGLMGPLAPRVGTAAAEEGSSTPCSDNSRRGGPHLGACGMKGSQPIPVLLIHQGSPS